MLKVENLVKIYDGGTKALDDGSNPPSDERFFD